MSDRRASSRGMTHDETVYEHPEVFDPSRFMSGDDLKGAGEYTDPREMFFGFGRRCVTILSALARS